MLFVLAFAVAYIAALVATVPARFVASQFALPPGVAMSGTIWNGEAALPAGPVLAWHLDALDSMLNFALSARWTLTAARTDLAGDVMAGSDRIVLTGVKGIAGWELARAVSPNLAADCDLSAEIAFSSVTIGQGKQSALGTLRTGAGSCTLNSNGGQRTIKLPALQAASVATATGSKAVLAEAGAPDRRWAEIELLPDRRIAATWYEIAIAAVSGATPSGPVMLEFGF